MTCTIKNLSDKKLVKMQDAHRGCFYIVETSSGLPSVGNLILKTCGGYEDLTDHGYSSGITHCLNAMLCEVDVEICILG